MLLGRLLGRESPEETRSYALYRQIVEQARQQVFYRDLGVPDNLDGRFELIALHAFLILHRLKQDHPQGAELSQSLHDLFFADMDQSLREMGAGDIGVGKRIKRMVQGFHGRVRAYDDGLGGDSGQLEDALRRNLYGTVGAREPWIEKMAGYTRAQSHALERMGFVELVDGKSAFAGTPLPTVAGEPL